MRDEPSRETDSRQVPAGSSPGDSSNATSVLPEGHESGNQGGGREGTSPNLKEVTDIGTACFAWVQKYQKGLCTKDSANVAITSILIESHFEPRAIISSLLNYRLILDSSRIEQPRSVNSDTLSQSKPPDSRGQETSEGPSVRPSNGTGTLELPAVAGERPRLWAATQTAEDGQQAGAKQGDFTSRQLEDGDDSDITDDNMSHVTMGRKQARSQSRSSNGDMAIIEYPWETVFSSSANLTIEQARTKQLLDSWNTSDRALKDTLKKLLRAPGIPRFPRSQLRNILVGEFVNLDKVYASVNSLVAETGIRAKLNDTISIELEGEVTSNHQVSARVTDQASYTVATNMLISIMLFVFGPYRRDELTSYFAHVQAMFTSIATSHHICVINYDRAVRLYIAQSNDVAFNEFTRFQHFKRANLHPLGINVSVDTSIARGARDRQPLNRRKANRSAEICRNYNAGRCTKSSNECTYRHFCSNCGKSGHSAKDSKCADGTSTKQT